MKTKIVNMRLTEGEIKRLKDFGKGNITEGLRNLMLHQSLNILDTDEYINLLRILRLLEAYRDTGSN